jgi:hypothetical protein
MGVFIRQWDLPISVAAWATRESGSLPLSLRSGSKVLRLYVLHAGTFIHRSRPLDVPAVTERPVLPLRLVTSRSGPHPTMLLVHLD